MKTDLNRIDTWLRKNRADYYKQLNKPASDRAIAKLEKLVGEKLPKAFKAFLQWKNGPSRDCYESLYANWSTLSTDRIVQRFDELNELLDGGEFELKNWWSKKWLPFLESPGGDLVVLDFEGTFTGNKGQILQFWHADEDRIVVHESFDKWLETVAAVVELNRKQGEAALTRKLNPGYPIRKKAGGKVAAAAKEVPAKKVPAKKSDSKKKKGPPAGVSNQISALVEKLKQAKLAINQMAPVPGDAQARAGAIRPHFGKLSWTPPPSYAAFLGLASAFFCVDEWKRGVQIFTAKGMKSQNRELVHLPKGVDRGDGITLTTNHLVGFASASHEAVWCFDVSSPDAAGEYPVYYHHQDEPRAKVLATGAWEEELPAEFPSFTAWLEAHVTALTSEKKPEWWNHLGRPVRRLRTQ